MGEKAVARRELRKALGRGHLSLYLGAGVSRGNHLPNWEELVIAMYFNAVSSEEITSSDGKRMRPFPNYLYAIAEWMLRRRSEPLEITARKLRMYYDELERAGVIGRGEGQDRFRENLQRTLYAALHTRSGAVLPRLTGAKLRRENETLDAVATLCEARRGPRSGVRSVITYNYDDLLEQALSKVKPQSIHRAEDDLDAKRLPIYHVHGFVPLRNKPVGSRSRRIIFTEDEYHLAARDAYSWSNLVQIQAMASHHGLLVGLSVTDPNMRRLLDAVRRAPVRGRAWALLMKPQDEKPDPADLRQMHERAIEKIKDFEKRGIEAGIKRDVSQDEAATWVKSDRPRRKSERSSGPKGEKVYERQIREILQGVHAIDFAQQSNALLELGVTPVWFSRVQDIATFLRSLAR